MIQKAVGVFLVMGTTSIGGLTAADKIKAQYGQLKYLQRLICLLRSEIRYTRAHLGEAFYQIGRSAKSPYREWLLGMYGEMEERKGDTLAVIWEEKVREYLRSSGLSKEAYERLADLGSQLGAADIEMQIKALDLYQEEIELAMKEMREGMRAKIRLCHCLGVMGGIFITVLLL